MLSLRPAMRKSDGINNMTKKEKIKYILHSVRCFLVGLEVRVVLSIMSVATSSSDITDRLVNIKKL